jgi:hypothetical protein
MASAWAQNHLSVLVNNNGTIALPIDQELQEVYEIDIASLEFESLEGAVEYFKELNSKYVLFRPNPDLNTAMLYLQLSKRPAWSVEQWNNLLAEVTIFTKY